MNSHSFRTLILFLLLSSLVSCTNDSATKAELPEPAVGTVEYCVKHAERVGTFYDGIKHFGTLSPNMPSEYRDCLEDKSKLKATLKEYKRQMDEVDQVYKKRKAAEKAQAKKDQALINSIRGE